MSDNLEWRNKHLVLLRYLTREDMEKNEKFRLDPSVAPVVEGITRAEDMIFKFADVGRWKCASEVITYAAHRRAAIWWLYTCLLSLNEELAINPAVDRDIATIGTDFEVKVPEWATAIQPPTIDPELNSKMDTALEGLEKTYQDMRAKCKPEYLEAIEEGMEVVQEEFKKVHGIRLDQAIEMIKAKLLQDPAEIDPNSPVIVESKKIKEQLKAVQKETVDLIKSVIPPKVPEHEKKNKRQRPLGYLRLDRFAGRSELETLSGRRQ